jgi:hypothetical protein
MFSSTSTTDKTIVYNELTNGFYWVVIAGEKSVAEYKECNKAFQVIGCDAYYTLEQFDKVLSKI